MARKVLMFCSQFRPLVGGAERQAEKLARILVQRGLEVTILTPELVHGTRGQEEAAGVRIVRFPLFDLSGTLPGVRGVGPINLLFLRWQILHAMGQYLKDACVVHAHIASPLTAFAMEAAQRAGVPVICKVATAGEGTDLGELAGSGLGGPRLARRLVLQMNRWVATTDAVRQSLLDWNISSSRIAVIPNGVELVDTSRIRARAALARRFLYLGRVSSNAKRDVPTLLHAFDSLANEVPGVELAIVGSGDLYGQTAELVTALRNRASVRMLGEQPPEQWLEWADCLVLPSRKEGLSNALLEAMSYGLACVANDIGPNREVLDNGQAGLLVEVGSSAAMLAAMRRMAVDPGAAVEVAQRGHERVTKCYSIQSVAQRYMELYDEVVAEGAEQVWEVRRK